MLCSKVWKANIGLNIRITYSGSKIVIEIEIEGIRSDGMRVIDGWR